MQATNKDKEQVKLAHVHKYLRVMLGGKRLIKDDTGNSRLLNQAGYPVMKCILPGCRHFISLELCIGRECVCWRCEGTMIMSNESIKKVHPTHKNCLQFT